jgi:hypothetical protein
MADTYANFRELARRERAGIDYRILARGALPSVMIVASHGGGIEPGTSEVADAAAAEELGFYAFEGLKLRGNGELRITSTRFKRASVPVADRTITGRANDSRRTRSGRRSVAVRRRAASSAAASDRGGAARARIRCAAPHRPRPPRTGRAQPVQPRAIEQRRAARTVACAAAADVRITLATGPHPVAAEVPRVRRRAAQCGADVKRRASIQSSLCRCRRSRIGQRQQPPWVACAP